MATSRKDHKGRVLRKGETQRKDLKYCYSYMDPFGHRRHIYSKDLKVLRMREEGLIRDQLDGLDIYKANTATLNYLFDKYMATKYNIRSSTRANYRYMYDHFVRDTFGKKLISKIRYSDVKFFYCHLVYKCDLQLNTLDNIHTLLHPAFQLAVRDGIIRTNPTDGVE